MLVERTWEWNTVRARVRVGGRKRQGDRALDEVNLSNFPKGSKHLHQLTT